MSEKHRTRLLAPEDADTLREAVSRFKKCEIDETQARAFLSSRDRVTWVAERSGEPVGWLFGYRILRVDGAGEQLFLYELETAPEYRRQGVATSLMEAAIEWARREELVWAFLLTNRSNAAAVRLYEKVGGQQPNGDDLLVRWQIADVVPP